jgi:hypothetical protein
MTLPINCPGNNNAANNNTGNNNTASHFNVTNAINRNICCSTDGCNSGEDVKFFDPSKSPLRC